MNQRRHETKHGQKPVAYFLGTRTGKAFFAHARAFFLWQADLAYNQNHQKYKLPNHTRMCFDRYALYNKFRNLNKKLPVCF